MSLNLLPISPKKTTEMQIICSGVDGIKVQVQVQYIYGHFQNAGLVFSPSQSTYRHCNCTYMGKKWTQMTSSTMKVAKIRRLKIAKWHTVMNRKLVTSECVIHMSDRSEMHRTKAGAETRRGSRSRWRPATGGSMTRPLGRSTHGATSLNEKWAVLELPPRSTGWFAEKLQHGGRTVSGQLRELFQKFNFRKRLRVTGHEYRKMDYGAALRCGCSCEDRFVSKMWHPSFNIEELVGTGSLMSKSK